MVQLKKYKIALITAYIGNGGDSELSFTTDAQLELDAYHVDVYRFNNFNVDELKPFLQPVIAKEEIINETWRDKLSYFYNSKYKFKQNLTPTEKDNYTRLIAKIPKILFFEVVPQDYDYYIWLDSKFTIHCHWLDYALWLINKYPNVDIITSLHSERASIKQELDLMSEQIKKYKTEIFLSKYNLAEVNSQVKFYLKSPKFVDDNLYELTMMVYSSRILGKTDFLKEWYAHNFYLSIQDQLSFPYLAKKYNIEIQGVLQDVFNMPFVNHEYTKHKVN